MYDIIKLKYLSKFNFTKTSTDVSEGFSYASWFRYQPCISILVQYKRVKARRAGQAFKLNDSNPEVLHKQVDFMDKMQILADKISYFFFSWNK